MTVGSFISAGGAFVRGHLKLVAIWGLLYAAAMLAFTVLMGNTLAPITAMQQQMALRQAALATGQVAVQPPFPAGAFGALFGAELAALLLALVMFAAVVRAVLDGGADRYAFVRLGRDELRLLGLAIVLILLFLLIEIIGMVVLAIIGGILGAIIGRGAIFALLIPAMLVFICAMIWIEVRLSLAGVLTMIERRIVIRDAWRTTRGHFWSLFGAFFVFGLIWMVGAMVFLAVSAPEIISAMTHGDAAAMMAANQARIASAASFSVMSVLRVLIGEIVFVPLGVAMIAGLTASTADLHGLRAGVAKTFD